MITADEWLALHDVQVYREGMTLTVGAGVLASEAAKEFARVSGFTQQQILDALHRRARRQA
ncbi:hypothetical protein ECNIH5_14315 [Enterobacter cloacae]|uniref:hypothetical protein n=1 Tax=Enterobacter cloacae complex TaxID=354276 RepID=UPI0004F64017|nr:MULTISPECIES: hypothetical protein [Enterobacter cloacae complex]AIX59867.1 hypothetical protein ECNIH5_14315 [Enterobacter cloacae]HAV1720322.1 hypothetical protein [Enterobacter hormaechei subsp. steigerwaltii]AIN23455.1 hypothetical protein ECNIH3_14400 [Enterobacter hormaechei subsp. hoffmannii ECNIH3]AIN28793.1 hypothetical protein ECR091_14335 [Enterobacter hormaechei subsp. hoffmannii ECR091]EKS6640561.1 hypothetical protein [Enterobacter hormaechei]